MTAMAKYDDTTIAKNYDQTDTTTRQLLLVCSFLASEVNVPIDLIASVMETGSEDIVISNLEHLVDVGLMERAVEGYQIQSETAEFIQSKSDPAKVKEVLLATARTLESVCSSFDNPAEIKPYYPHIEVLAQKTQIQKMAISGLLYGHLGYYWLSENDYQEAVKYFRRALLIIEKVSGVESVEYTEHLNNLGSALYKLKNLEEAKKCFEQVIITDKKILGKKHPAVAIGLNNLGQVLLELNNIDGAILHLEDALEINKSHFGVEHPHVAAGYYNFGMALIDIGDLPRAKIEIQRSLLIRQKIFGDIHPGVAEAHHGLGMVFQTISNLSEAETHYRQALRIWESDGSQDNLQLAASYTNLGGVLHLSGDLVGAKSNYLSGLEIFEACLPPDDKNIRDLRLQLELLEHGMTMPELLEKMEAGENLPAELLKILDKMFGDNA